MTTKLGSSELLVKVKAIASFSYELLGLAELRSPKVGETSYLAGRRQPTTPAVKSDRWLSLKVSII
jgi:hypothetical protein